MNGETTMSAEVEKFMELEKKENDLKTRKIRIEEQLKAKKQALTDLIKEIKAAGYDANDLQKLRTTKKQEAKEKLEKYETDLNKLSEELSKIEG
jgi:hypothetical protein